MAPIRLRHPKGVATLQISLESDSYTVQGAYHLQQEIYSASGILPSRQSLKCGYPPRVLTLIPELPVASLGLSSGEQLIVSELAGDGPAPAAPSSPPIRAASTSSSPSPRPQDVLSPGPKPSASNEPDAVEIEGSFLVHRVVPDDNSCLFSSVALIFEQDMQKAQRMRQLVGEGIRADPATYSEAILGLPPSDYISKITKPITWGGAIELGILAKHYKTEIASIDIETGRVDQFTPEGFPENRCILLYSGIHYDAATLAPMKVAPSEWHQTVFPTSNAEILVAGKKLADILRAKRKYTNTSTFDLKCEQCGTGVKGEKGAQAHAKETGHTKFGEY
ncbi:OTU-like cysteine [Mycena indigotica]|uniref:Ubiquitin thioesterase OTU n=1 Tax=Mycena indigotica TaxID=2126181 RepID=A0A8H6S9S2_9AGAR|nr:OTU-like cysteine [Mycena indigotica]KAF7294795.1 OTU-like cysteine [Mycena indigotica]